MKNALSTVTQAHTNACPGVSRGIGQQAGGAHRAASRSRLDALHREDGVRKSFFFFLHVNLSWAMYYWVNLIACKHRRGRCSALITVCRRQSVQNRKSYTRTMLHVKRFKLVGPFSRGKSPSHLWARILAPIVRLQHAAAALSSGYSRSFLGCPSRRVGYLQFTGLGMCSSIGLEAF